MSWHLTSYQWLWRLLSPMVRRLVNKQCALAPELTHCHHWRQGRHLADLPVGFHRPIWFHGASVGEINTFKPVIQAYIHAYPAQSILLTTTTTTGFQTAQHWVHQWTSTQPAMVALLPLDRQQTMQRFLTHFQPAQCVILETEIWPMLWYLLQQAHIPIHLLNARLTPKALKRYQRFVPKLMQQTIQRAQHIQCQSEADHQRFTDLGATANQLSVAPNFKWLAPTQAPDKQLAQTYIQTHQLQHRLIWIFASTHDGEETLALQVHQQIQQSHPNALLILVPRHPQRFSTVQQLLASQTTFRFVTRSSQQSPQTADVLLGDSMGELLFWYQISPITVMGGTFVNIGGHNVLEAVSCHSAVIVGPYTHEQANTVQPLKQAQGLHQVENEKALVSTILKLQHPNEHQITVSNATGYWKTQQRAIQTTVQHLLSTFALTPNHT